MKRALFIDRDGTLIDEPKDTHQIDSLERLRFIPGVFSALGQIAKRLSYELVLITNQDGLGTESFPEDTFWPAQNKMLEALAGEGITFSDILIDRSFAHERLTTRKPGLGMLGKYLTGEYELSRCFVIGDRVTDIELAKNLGAQAIYFAEISDEAIASLDLSPELADCLALRTNSWSEIQEFLRQYERQVSLTRTTAETNIAIELALDGSGTAELATGLGFFDHMLAQVARHSGANLKVTVEGDLEVDEHHTIEDTAIALGQAVSEALGDKRGIHRYAFLLPMDDCLAQVALDFSGRAALVWEAEFRREMIGDMPCEMFSHFFKSFCDAARCNLNIKAEGINEHHKIEAIFKAFAKCLGQAWRVDSESDVLPSTKGVL